MSVRLADRFRMFGLTRTDFVSTIALVVHPSVGTARPSKPERARRAGAEDVVELAREEGVQASPWAWGPGRG